MGPLAVLERFLERLFERPSARLFGARLQPIQLQHRLERAMESDRLTSSGRTVVPNDFEVRLSPADWAQFEDVAETLAGELADACLAYARQRHYTLRDRPRVTLLADESLPSGEATITTAFGRAVGRPPGAATAGPRNGQHASPGEAEAGASGPEPAREVEAVARPDAAAGGIAPTPVTEHTMVFEVPQARAPKARLRLETPDGGQRDVEVSGAPLSLGRATDNDLVIRDGRVSRHHARLQPRAGTLVLTDLGSTNGTRVNGVTVQEVALGDGDRIELGDSVLTVEATRDR